MKHTTIAAIVSMALLAGCATDGVVAPVAPMLSVSAEGNPPPPRVFGTLGAAFSASPLDPAATQQFVFRAPAYYNRNLTTGVNLLELATGPGNIRADASGVVRASGVVVLVDPGTGAQLTVDLSQLVGYTGPLFGACPAPSPVNCFLLNATLTGLLQPVNGPPVPATGRFQYRWDSN